MKGRALLVLNLRRIRVGKGLSQEKLAFDAAVDRAYLGGLERKEENPTFDLLDRIAESLKTHSLNFCRACTRRQTGQAAEERAPRFQMRRSRFSGDVQVIRTRAAKRVRLDPVAS
ncbi:MAG: helix-turn-helix transcriptional regulator [Rhodomicrobium sp.]